MLKNNGNKIALKYKDLNIFAHIIKVVKKILNKKTKQFFIKRLQGLKVRE